MAANVTDKSSATINKLHKRIHVGLAPVASDGAAWPIVNKIEFVLQGNRHCYKHGLQATCVCRHWFECSLTMLPRMNNVHMHYIQRGESIQQLSKRYFF